VRAGVDRRVVLEPAVEGDDVQQLQMLELALVSARRCLLACLIARQGTWLFEMSGDSGDSMRNSWT
jgi:hypothetical protein